MSALTWRWRETAVAKKAMRLYRSSDLQHLVDCLERILEEPGPDLLEPEVIIVQSAGMARWLSRELAKRRGIAANFSFLFPRAFLRDTFDRVLGPDARTDSYEGTRLVWALYSLLGETPPSPLYESVTRYQAQDVDGAKRLQLAIELADLFDQYLTYRPQMMLRWARGGEPSDFQEHLFQRLVARLGPHHFAERVRAFLSDASSDALASALPSRLTIVGGPGLPPIYLRLLSRMGTVVPVHVLSFQVCGEYFADLHPHDEPLPELGAGAHPLLVSLGRVGADFQQMVEQVGDYVEVDAYFPRRPADTLLAHLQNDIQVGNRRAARDLLPEAALTDGSLTVDSCHSRLREVEVLADRLLGWFREDPSLRPEDVVVLSPDIESYSPLISAVFAARAQAGARLPHRIADRSEGASNPAAKALLLGLDLLSSRLKVSALLDFLQLQPVQHRFQLSPVDLERIADWVRKSGIRWGADADHVKDFGIDSDGAHTLDWGLRRLLFGYACSDDGETLVQGIVPVDDVPASDAELLGRFVECCQRLLSFRAQAHAGQRTPREWFEWIAEFSDAFVPDEGNETWDGHAVREILAELRDAAGPGSSPVPLPAAPLDTVGLGPVVRLLTAELSRRSSGTEFLGGGITFCALLPLRTIPFRRVCVLGLDQAQFPRADDSRPLSLIEQSPKIGDRILRGDDRFLFLELIMAAKERLSLSYVGRSVQDNSECPASVVVTELLAVLAGMVAPPSARDEGSVLHDPVAFPVVAHPLQPFSPRYFANGGALLSFDERSFAGARALCQLGTDDSGESARGSRPFVDGPLRPWQTDEELQLPLEQLVRFYKDPARAFLSNLDVRIDDGIEQFEDREPVQADALVRYFLGEELVRAELSGVPVLEEVMLRRALLPPASAGRVDYEKVRDQARRIAAAAVFHRGPQEERTVEVELRYVGKSEEGAEIRTLLGARLPLSGEVWLAAGYGALNAKRMLAHWIGHLALCAAEHRPRSVLIGRAPPSSKGAHGEVVILEFEAVAKRQADECLAQLVSGYLSGMERPLCFFPEASLSFSSQCLRTGGAELDPETRERAFAALSKFFETTGGASLLSPEVEQAFRGMLPLVGFSDAQREQFARVSLEVFLPLLAARSVRGESEPA